MAYKTNHNRRILYSQMKYIIEESDRTPAYIQLYRLVRDDIVSGVYPYNSKLPSKRTVAEEMGISTITVEHAYYELRHITPSFCKYKHIDLRQRENSPNISCQRSLRKTKTPLTEMQLLSRTNKTIYPRCHLDSRPIGPCTQRDTIISPTIYVCLNVTEYSAKLTLPLTVPSAVHLPNSF